MSSADQRKVHSLEHRLTDEFARRVDVAPARPHIADAALRRGRKARRRRTVLATGGAAAVVAGALAAVALVPSRTDDRTLPAANLSGPPRVPLFVAQGEPQFIDWVGGGQRTRPAGEGLPVAHVPSGLLLVGQRSLALLGEADQQPRCSSTASNHPASRCPRTADASQSRPGRAAGRLQEVEIASRRTVRSVPLSPQMFAESARVLRSPTAAARC
jgi:hypothetical protein